MKLEALDARVKLYMLLALSSLCVASRRPGQLLAALLLTVLILLSGGVSPARALWRVKSALSLIFMVFVLQCVFNRRGEALLSLGGFTLVTREGFVTALCVLIRFIVIILSGLMILTGARRDYLLALRQLGLPYEICFMVMAGLHFLPLLREEAQDVMYAVQMRGTKISGTSLKNRLSVYLRVAIPVVAGAIRRSEQMSVAMEARAFRSMPGRSSMRTLKMKKSDWLYMGAFTAAIILIILGGCLWKFL